MPEESVELDDTVLWLVWGALLFSMLIYVVVPVALPPPAEFEPIELAEGNPPKIAVILGGASLILVPLLFRMRDQMFFSPLGDECYPGSPEARGAYFKMSLTSWVMCEVVGVFGFAIYLDDLRARLRRPVCRARHVVAATLSSAARCRRRRTCIG